MRRGSAHRGLDGQPSIQHRLARPSWAQWHQELAGDDTTLAHVSSSLRAPEILSQQRQISLALHQASAQLTLSASAEYQPSEPGSHRHRNPTDIEDRYARYG